MSVGKSSWFHFALCRSDILNQEDRRGLKIDRISLDFKSQSSNCHFHPFCRKNHSSEAIMDLSTWNSLTMFSEEGHSTWSNVVENEWSLLRDWFSTFDQFSRRSQGGQLLTQNPSCPERWRLWGEPIQFIGFFFRATKKTFEKIFEAVQIHVLRAI